MHEHRAVFLIESDEPGWLAVRRAIETLPDTYLAGSASSLDDARALTVHPPPDAIIAARYVDDEPVIPLLRVLRPQLPETTFIIIADDYDDDELLAMGQVGISGYLLWRHLRGARLHAYLQAAIYGDTVVVSDTVADAYVAAERRQLNPEGLPEITERERQILRGLAEGLTQFAIARQIGVGDRTIQANVASLKLKLDANSEFTLAVQAIRRGLIR